MSKYNSGVYRIDIGDNYYFGISSDLRRRIRRHLSRLNSGKHHNPHMQAAYNKHREFFAKHLVYCNGEYMQRLESDLIGSHIDDARCMNQVVEDPYGLRVFGEDARLRMRESHLGKKLSHEQRKKIGDAQRGRKHSEESIRKMRESKLGKPRSPETIKKVADALRGRKLSADAAQKLADARKMRGGANAKVVVLSWGGGEFYFPSALVAANYINVPANMLRKRLSGERPWPTRPGSKLAGLTGHYIDKWSGE